MISVSAFAEPLAQRLRVVGSGLKFCEQRLKYGCHNYFSISVFEMDENKVQIYKPLEVFICLQGRSLQYSILSLIKYIKEGTYRYVYTL